MEMRRFGIFPCIKYCTGWSVAVVVVLDDMAGFNCGPCGLFAFTANMNFCLPAAAAAAANSWFDVRIAAAEVALSPPFGPPGNDCCDCCRW